MLRTELSDIAQKHTISKGFGIARISLKGIVHPKIIILSLMTRRSKPVHPQIKIFLMKSESSLTLHTQQGS